MVTQKVFLSGGPHNAKRVADPETFAQDFTFGSVTAWYYRDLDTSIPVGLQQMGVYRHLDSCIYRGGPRDTDTEDNSPMRPVDGNLVLDGVNAAYVRTTLIEKQGTKVYAVYLYVEDSAQWELSDPTVRKDLKAMLLGEGFAETAVDEVFEALMADPERTITREDIRQLLLSAD